MIAISSLIAKGFLLFSNAIIIAPLLLIGFATRGGFFIKPPSREGLVIWGNACLLVLFTMIFNVFLKSLFLIPLNPTLGIEGYAFPSGHMQVVVVFYGLLFQAYSNPTLLKILLFILVGIAYGLIQQGYHNVEDIAGSIVFGVATLVSLAKVTTFSSIQKNPSRLGLYLIPLAGVMVAGRSIRIGISPHIIITFLGLISFSLLWLGLSYYSRGKNL